MEDLCNAKPKINHLISRDLFNASRRWRMLARILARKPCYSICVQHIVSVTTHCPYVSLSQLDDTIEISILPVLV